MTIWDTGTNNLTSTGTGKIALRLKIDGLDYEWVTDVSMEKTSDDIKRRVGLLKEGVKIVNKAIPVEGIIESDGISFKIVDINGEATACFRRKATLQTRIRGNTSTTATTIYVNETSNGAASWGAGDIFWVGQEAIKIGSAQARKFSTCTRGYYNTTPQSHVIVSQDNFINRPMVTNIPGASRVRLKGRGVTLYLYDSVSDPQGDGTQIWRGTCRKNAAPKGEAYVIQTEDISAAMKGKIGNSFEKAYIRGIYFSKESWRISLRLDPGAMPGSDPDPTAYEYKTIILSGFYEDKYALVNELNEKLIVATSAWNTKCTARIVDDEMVILLHTNGTPQFIMITTTGGITDSGRVAEDFDEESTRGTPTGYVRSELTFQHITMLREYTASDVSAENSFGEASYGVYANKSYATKMVRRPFPDALTAYYGTDPIAGGARIQRFRPHPRRIFLDVEDLPPDNADVNLKAFTDSDDAAVNVLSELDPGELEINNADRSIISTNPQKFVIRNEDIYFKFGVRFLGNRAAGRDTNHIADFIKECVKKSPDYYGQGWMPLITDKDFNTGSFDTFMSESNRTAFTHKREYSFWGEEQNFEDLLKAEVQLVGGLLSKDSLGRFALKPLRQVGKYEAVDFVFEDKDILTDMGWESLQQDVWGNYNIVKIKTGWNGVKGEHEGPTFNFVNKDSIDELGQFKKEIEIAPMSEESSVPNYEQIADIVEPVMLNLTEIFGFPYDVLSFETHMKFFKAAIGDTCSISSPRIPRNDGTRGGLHAGIIVGTSWDLSTGFGSVRVLLSPDPYWGEQDYGISIAPGFFGIGSGTGDSVTFDELPDFSGGVLEQRTDAVRHIAPGEAIRIIRADFAQADGYFEGWVSGIDSSGGNMTFTIDVDPGGPSVPSDFSDGTGDYRIAFAPEGSAGLTAKQKEYAFTSPGTVESNPDSSFNINMGRARGGKFGV